MVKRIFNYHHRFKNDGVKIDFTDLARRTEEALRTPEFQAKINRLFGYPKDFEMDKTSPLGGNK